jgi:hypothetical protein
VLLIFQTRFIPFLISLLTATFSIIIYNGFIILYDIMGEIALVLIHLVIFVLILILILYLIIILILILVLVSVILLFLYMISILFSITFIFF